MDEDDEDSQDGSDYDTPVQEGSQPFSTSPRKRCKRSSSMDTDLAQQQQQQAAVASLDDAMDLEEEDESAEDDDESADDDDEVITPYANNNNTTVTPAHVLHHQQYPHHQYHVQHQQSSSYVPPTSIWKSQQSSMVLPQQQPLASSVPSTPIQLPTYQSQPITITKRKMYSEQDLQKQRQAWLETLAKGEETLYDWTRIRRLTDQADPNSEQAGLPSNSNTLYNFEQVPVMFFFPNHHSFP